MLVDDEEVNENTISLEDVFELTEGDIDESAPSGKDLNSKFCLQVHTLPVLVFSSIAAQETTKNKAGKNNKKGAGTKKKKSNKKKAKKSEPEDPEAEELRKLKQEAKQARGKLLR